MRSRQDGSPTPARMAYVFISRAVARAQPGYLAPSFYAEINGRSTLRDRQDLGKYGRLIPGDGSFGRSGNEWFQGS